MQYKNLCLVGLLGLCLIIGHSMAAPEGIDSKIELPSICDVLPALNSSYDLGGVKNKTIDVSDTTYLYFTAKDIMFKGLDQLELDCSPERINGTIWVSGLDIMEYTLTGVIVDNIHVTGNGHASIMMEQFGFAIEDESGSGVIMNPKLDLWMYQWTVLFEDLMPGTDLGLLFNEFMSELGPEVANAIEDMINADKNGVQKFINKLLGAKMN